MENEDSPSGSMRERERGSSSFEVPSPSSSRETTEIPEGGLPRHHHPTRLSDILEEDKRPRVRESRLVSGQEKSSAEGAPSSSKPRIPPFNLERMPGGARVERDLRGV
jgi:hypothetical protein